jgi:hypothetical protein
VYTGSRAFAGRGARTFFNGLEVEEVKNIEIGPTIRVWANFSSTYESHMQIMRAILNGKAVGLAFEGSDGQWLGYHARPITGQITFPLNDAVLLYFEQVQRALPDTADDGPEVDIINKVRMAKLHDRIMKAVEEQRQEDVVMEELADDLAFEELLRKYFLAERAVKKFVSGAPAGGGFTIVHESTLTDGCKFHNAPDKG